MYLLIDILGLVVFIAIAFLFSRDRKDINWRAVAILLVVNLVIAVVLTKFSWGRDAVNAVAYCFKELIKVADVGIAFAIPNWVHVKQQNFITSALLPILLIVPLFDILNYLGVLPWIIKWVGKALSWVTGQPRFESFYAVETALLGDTEALAVSRRNLAKLRATRDLTIAMMSMSSVSGSILASYMQMIPGRYVLTAVPLNIINACLVTSILNPVKVSNKEDIESSNNLTNNKGKKTKKPPFFSFLSDSILSSGELILIIIATVISFVALAALIDALLGLINPWLSLEHLLGIVMFPFTWLLGLDPGQAFQFAQNAGLKLITNEFVTMGRIAPYVYHLSAHYQAEICVFLTSFANFGTLGMIIGVFKGIVNKERNNVISRNVGYIFLSGIIVSLMSAGIIGLFVW